MVEARIIGWEDVNDKEKETKYRALGDTVGDRGYGEFAAADGEILMSVGEVRFKTGEGGSVELEVADEDGVVNGAEGAIRSRRIMLLEAFRKSFRNAN